jgi:hypothetical protein
MIGEDDDFDYSDLEKATKQLDAVSQPQAQEAQQPQAQQPQLNPQEFREQMQQFQEEQASLAEQEKLNAVMAQSQNVLESQNSQKLDAYYEEILDGLSEENVNTLSSMRDFFESKFGEKVGDELIYQVLHQVPDVNGFVNFSKTPEGQDEIMKTAYKGITEEMQNYSQKDPKVRDSVSKIVMNNVSTILDKFSDEVRGEEEVDDIGNFAQKYSPVNTSAFSEIGNDIIDTSASSYRQQGLKEGLI